MLVLLLLLSLSQRSREGHGHHDPQAGHEEEPQHDQAISNDYDMI